MSGCRVSGFGPAIVVLYPTSVQYLSDGVPKPDTLGAAASPPLGLASILRPRTLTRLREELKRVAPRAWREWLWQAQVKRQLAGREPGWRYTDVPLDRLARVRGRSPGLRRNGPLGRRGAGPVDPREPVRGRQPGRFVAARRMAALLPPARRAGHPGV